MQLVMMRDCNYASQRDSQSKVWLLQPSGQSITLGPRAQNTDVVMSDDGSAEGQLNGYSRHGRDGGEKANDTLYIPNTPAEPQVSASRPDQTPMKNKSQWYHSIA